ncbi:MAG: amino acid ABC transporter permease [Clostridiales bacterium]
MNFFDKIYDALYATFIDAGRWQMFVEGLGNTLKIAAVATLIGVCIGVTIAMIRVYHKQSGKMYLADKICGLYLTVIRGTPMLVQLMIMYYVIFSNARNGVPVAMLAFGVNSGAYVAEIVRAGINAVDKGQAEAGRSLGLNGTSTMKSIVLPQAIKNILPALGNEFIVLLKETSIVGYIAIVDLTKAGDIARSRTYDAFTSLISVALMYLVLVIGLQAILKAVERRMAKSDRS